MRGDGECSSVRNGLYHRGDERGYGARCVARVRNGTTGAEYEPPARGVVPVRVPCTL